MTEEQFIKAGVQYALLRWGWDDEVEITYQLGEAYDNDYDDPFEWVDKQAEEFNFIDPFGPWQMDPAEIKRKQHQIKLLKEQFHG